MVIKKLIGLFEDNSSENEQEERLRLAIIEIIAEEGDINRSFTEERIKSKICSVSRENEIQTFLAFYDEFLKALKRLQDNNQIVKNKEGFSVIQGSDLYKRLQGTL